MLSYTYGEKLKLKEMSLKKGQLLNNRGSISVNASVSGEEEINFIKIYTEIFAKRDRGVLD